MKTRKRSNAPIFWGLFGAGGMLAALFGPMLVFITGLAVPLGLLLPSGTMSYQNMLAFAQNFIGRASSSWSSRSSSGMPRTAFSTRCMKWESTAVSAPSC